MRSCHLAAVVLTTLTLRSLPASAQSPAVNADRPVPHSAIRITTLPGRSLPPRLTGKFISLTAESLALNADSVNVLVAPDDSTRIVRLPCGACVEARLALVDLVRVEVAAPPPTYEWKRTRRRGAIWGALGTGAVFAGAQASRSDGGVVAAAVTGAVLGAWIGGAIGAGWPVRQEWRVIYQAPPPP